MSLGDIFGYISSKTEQVWTKLGSEMGMGKELSCKNFGEIASEFATEKGAKCQPFFMMNTAHLFGHFRFTDFRETWRESVCR